jgi:hypothetical protein
MVISRARRASPAIVVAIKQQAFQGIEEAGHYPCQRVAPFGTIEATSRKNLRRYGGKPRNIHLANFYVRGETPS